LLPEAGRIIQRQTVLSRAAEVCQDGWVPEV